MRNSFKNITLERRSPSGKHGAMAEVPVSIDFQAPAKGDSSLVERGTEAQGMSCPRSPSEGVGNVGSPVWQPCI